MKISGVIFDAFGTLIDVKKRTNPFLQLLKHGRRQGRKYRTGDTQIIMTQDLDLTEAALSLEIRIGYLGLQRLERLLEEELNSMTLFPDALEAIDMLRQAGIRIAVCSNLASVYGPPVQQLLPGLDAFGFSYQIGATKPSPIIYMETCKLLGVAPGELLTTGERVLMIGDSRRFDRDGARANGISGFWINRRDGGDFSNLVDFAEMVMANVNAP
ncbi:HAD family hydrolase [Pseudomonas savastanoi]|uniref:HAD family hydrolase n=1 Tax=Pseudomonas savastanoi TaxID=29438 RepID=UPI000EFF5BB8|nr:HAD family hydrolase [Pseudomonas savastanoi]